MAPIRYLLRLAAGKSPHRDLVFRRGEPLAVFAAGTAGAWRVRAEGVLPVHVRFAFNGVDLWVAAATPTADARLDGVLLAPRWVPVRQTAQLELGAARVAILPRAVPPPLPVPHDDAATQPLGADAAPCVPTRLSEHVREAVARQKDQEVTALADPDVLRRLQDALRRASTAAPEARQPLVPPGG